MDLRKLFISPENTPKIVLEDPSGAWEMCKMIFVAFYSEMNKKAAIIIFVGNDYL